jgi:hypothetical protein
LSFLLLCRASDFKSLCASELLSLVYASACMVVLPLRVCNTISRALFNMREKSACE